MVVRAMAARLSTMARATLASNTTKVIGKGKEMKGKAKGKKGMAKADGKDNIVDEAASNSETVRRRRTHRGYHTGNPDVG
eukprot:1858185-Amphidinium_carterae.1